MKGARIHVDVEGIHPECTGDLAILPFGVAVLTALMGHTNKSMIAHKPPPLFGLLDSSLRRGSRVLRSTKLRQLERVARLSTDSSWRLY